VAGWLGISAPAGTPPDIVAKMNAATQAAVNDPATADKLRALGLTPEAMDTARFDTFVKEDTARWKEWIKISGIQPQ
ncbi:tripartite tricarboxylate transporter substrate-binding protein, partial [Achromobacter xylosoxidans]